MLETAYVSTGDVFKYQCITLTQANALNASLTWGEEIRYPSWLGNWSTKMCYINGSLAYCLESSKKLHLKDNMQIVSLTQTRHF